MKHYVHILFNLIFFNEFSFIAFLTIICFFTVTIIYKKKVGYNISIDKLKITNLSEIILISCVYLFIYLLFFIYLRFLNIQRNIDLKIIIFKLYSFFITNNIFIILVKLALLLPLIILAFQISKIIKKYFFYHFLKIHIYLLHLTREEDLIYQSKYEIILARLSHIEYMLSLFNILYFIFVRVYELYSIKYPNYKKDVIYAEPSFLFASDMIRYIGYYTFSKYRVILLFLGCILYDIISNNMILNITYYFGALLGLYYLFIYATYYVCLIETTDCLAIADYLTKERKIVYGNIIVFNDNTSIYTDDIDALNRSIIKAYETNYFRYAITKNKGENWLLFFNFILITNMYCYYNLEITVNVYNSMIDISLQNILLLVISGIILSWVYYKKNIIKYVLILFTSVVFISWFILSIIHYVPLLYQELLIDSSIRIKNIYSNQEKVYFIIEYAKYKLQFIKVPNENYFINILTRLPLQDLVETNSITDLKSYVDNLLKIYVKMEHQYVTLYDNKYLITFLKMCHNDIYHVFPLIKWNLIDFLDYYYTLATQKINFKSKM
jgi:hypothetical protein